MPMWKFSPVSVEENPYWKSCGYKRPLLVEAHDYYEAQIKATRWYKELFHSDRCAFNDENLYRIDRLNEEAASAEQQRYPTVQ